MTIQPRPEILTAPVAYHGAFDYDELEQLGFSPDEVIDFSVNSNSYGPPPGVREAIANVPLDRYPDRECIALRRKLTEKHDVAIENIVAGNGTAELLLLTAMAFIRPGDKVLVIEPDFSEYKRVATLVGGNVTTYRANSENDFQYDFSEIARLISQEQPRLVFWCNPNNPTGVTADVQSLGGLVDTFRDVLFVFDEAYVTFHHNQHATPSMLFQTRGYDNALVMRSMTKDYGLAGLRLGYAVGTPDIVAAVARVRPAWNVNSLAQTAGLAALAEEEFIILSMHRLQEEKTKLAQALESLGLQTVPSDVHYFLVKVDNATAFRSKLLRHKIMVRDCTSFGLPQYVRIATRIPEDNTKLIRAVRTVLAEGIA